MKAAEEGKHESAVAAFEQSYNVVASPNSHLMLARSLIQLGKLLEARQHLQTTIEEADAAARVADKYAETASAARKDLADVQAKLARVTIKILGADPSDRVRVGERRVKRSAWGKPILVDPGKTYVTLVDQTGAERQRVDLDVAEGASETVEIDLTPPQTAPSPARPPPPPPAPPPPPPSRAPAYLAGGVGVAGLATFTLLGLLSNSKFSKLENECTGNQCPSNLAGEADAGRIYQTAANVGLVVGAVGLGAAVVLYLTSEPGSEQPQDGDSARLLIGPERITLSGSF
jgi:hypothetical protein